MNIGENIKKERKKRNISQEGLSNLSGIPRVTLSRYETGTRIPNINVLNKISEALDVPLDNLIYQPDLKSYSNNYNFDKYEESSGYIINKVSIDTKKYDLNLNSYKKELPSFFSSTSNTIKSEDNIILDVSNYENDSKRSTVTESLINLLSYTSSNDNIASTLTSKEIDSILSKVCELIEFELYKLSKK